MNRHVCVHTIQNGLHKQRTNNHDNEIKYHIQNNIQKISSLIDIINNINIFNWQCMFHVTSAIGNHLPSAMKIYADSLHYHIDDDADIDFDKYVLPEVYLSTSPLVRSLVKIAAD